MDFLILNVKDWDCWELFVVRYLWVIMSFFVGVIGFFDWYGFFSMKGLMSVSKCWKCLGDIFVNLSLKMS